MIGPLPVIVIAVVAAVVFLATRKPKKTLAQQTEEANQEYYANKEPRRFK